MENKKQLDKRLVAVIAVLVLVIVGLVGFLLLRQNTIGIEDGDTPKVAELCLTAQRLLCY